MKSSEDFNRVHGPTVHSKFMMCSFQWLLMSAYTSLRLLTGTAHSTSRAKMVGDFTTSTLLSRGVEPKRTKVSAQSKTPCGFTKSDASISDVEMSVPRTITSIPLGTTARATSLFAWQIKEASAHTKAEHTPGAGCMIINTTNHNHHHRPPTTTSHHHQQHHHH